MAGVRPETIFKIGGKEYRARPSFDKVEKLEQRFGAMYPIMVRMESGNFGMSDVRDALQIILDTPKRGGPRQIDLEEAVFEDYGELLKALGGYIADSVTDRAAPPLDPLKKGE